MFHYKKVKENPNDINQKEVLQNQQTEVLYRKKRSKQFCKIHRKTTVLNFFVDKVAGLQPETLLKRRLWYSCFPVSFSKFLNKCFFKEHLRWLFLAL